MADTANFTKLVPGFDFLQNLVKNAGSAIPGIGQWVAPTLDPEELEKRIEELRTVQFWLEQNARMLGATIQALEVQRMTLSTLKTMNVQMADLRDSMRLKLPETPAGTAKAEPAAETPSPRAGRAAAGRRKGAGAKAMAPAGVVDPMQWWSALTKQFTQVATTAMKDTATDAARELAGTMVKQSFDAAGQTLKKAAEMPGKLARSVVPAGSPPKATPARRKSGGASMRPRRSP